MKPRTAGILGMAAALIITGLSGALIGHPPFSILGALGLVGGTILLAVAGTWIVRNSWDPTDWANISVPVEKAMRRYRRLALFESVFGPLCIGFGVWELATGSGTGWLFILLGASNIASGAATLVAMKKVQFEELRKESP
jgi:hypothetical protein